MLDINDIYEAINTAAKGRRNRRDVRAYTDNLPANAAAMLSAIKDGSYVRTLGYRRMRITNVNGKKRDVLSPDFPTLCLQHAAIIKLNEFYKKKDPMVGVNCKDGCGVTADWGEGSVAHRMKHIFYDRRDLEYGLVIDQRKCYDHVTRKTLRRALKELGVPRELADFCVNVSFCGERFPIGTPTSPLCHHVIMLGFDLFLKEISPLAVRYADDVFAPFRTRDEAQRAKWRIKNYWWYRLGLRAKRHTVTVCPLSLPVDFCGIVLHRTPGKGVCDHGKGYATLRKSTVRRALKATERSWPSYFGMLRQVDGYGMMMRIEGNDMNLKRLTEKIRVNRSLDARNIQVKELADEGTVFAVHDFEIRKDKDGIANWIKCLISYPDGNGRRLMREFHGNYSGIIQFHLLCEMEFGHKDILPMTGMRIVNSCGYIYEGSTNMLTEIDDTEDLNR